MELPRVALVMKMILRVQVVLLGVARAQQTPGADSHDPRAVLRGFLFHAQPHAFGVGNGSPAPTRAFHEQHSAAALHLWYKRIGYVTG